MISIQNDLLSILINRKLSTAYKLNKTYNKFNKFGTTLIYIDYLFFKLVNKILITLLIAEKIIRVEQIVEINF